MKRYFIHWGIFLSIVWSTLACAEPANDTAQMTKDDIAIEASGFEDTDRPKKATQAQAMGLQIAQQLVAQLPLAAQQEQLAQMQQSIEQLHHQLAQLLERIDETPFEVSSSETRGLFSALVVTNPLWLSGFLLVFTLVLAAWSLYRRWLVIGKTDFTSVEDMLQDVSHDKVASQLDMAMTYFSLEQYPQALALVEQVIANGNEAQRTEARLLQQQIQQAVEAA